ncbi:MAG: acyl-CoA dehydrogenase family protein [Gammaproteobacteria bacterium]
MSTSLTIPPCTLPPECEALRGQVREFLRAELPDYPPRLRAVSWSGFSPEFSRKLGARGWIGMTWPKKYGGHERSYLERYVVLEELLAAGAPCGAHWTVDRQSGPLLLKFGTEEQRQRLLPAAARGELVFCIGMSEPDSGSDLASTRSRAERVEGGWRVNGRKIWTSKANKAHYMIALLRTAKVENDRHAGLSQFLVDLKSPGIHIRPITNLVGEQQFNEVLFEDVLLPADALVGGEGQGWSQVGTELAYERSGPERYLTSIQLLIQMIRAANPGDRRQAVALGRLIAEARTLRRMSLGVAGMLARGETPGTVAAVVKELGTTFEQRIPEICAEVFEIDPGAAGDFTEVATYIMQVSTSFSLRGGTREVLRGMIARGLGLR